MNAGNNIPQTMSAESGAKNDTFPQMDLNELKSALDSQICIYYPKITEGEISQQSADQFPWLHINPVEFDGIRIQADLWNPILEKEEQQ
jgi:hypothetical protein